MTNHKVWDPFVRLFHWSVALCFAANALFVDDDAALHEWIGYTVVALLAARIVWGLVGPDLARFSSFTPRPGQIAGQIRDIATDRPRVHLGHSPLGALMIFNLIAALMVIGFSGYLMTTDMFWGIDWMEDLHEVAVTWTEVSVVIHIFAVIWESRRTHVNLPRAMVTGIKTLPDGARPSE